MIDWFQGLPGWMQATAVAVAFIATVTLLAYVDAWWWGHK